MEPCICVSSALCPKDPERAECPTFFQCIVAQANAIGPLGWGLGHHYCVHWRRCCKVLPRQDTASLRWALGMGSAQFWKLGSGLWLSNWVAHLFLISVYASFTCLLSWHLLILDVFHLFWPWKHSVLLAISMESSQSETWASSLPLELWALPSN